MTELPLEAVRRRLLMRGIPRRAYFDECRGRSHRQASHPVLANNVVYPSIAAAARAMGIHRATLLRRIKRCVPGYAYR
jgi:hypothetical protein